VVEVFDNIPDVAVEPEPLITGLKSCDVGYHRWAVETQSQSGADILRLKVELKYTPFLYPDRIAFLQAHITNGLRARNSCFDKLLKSGKLEFSIDFQPPNTLEKVIV
jgi:hypothetical protein